jgi:hypothetical protein
MENKYDYDDHEEQHKRMKYVALQAHAAVAPGASDLEVAIGDSELVVVHVLLAPWAVVDDWRYAGPVAGAIRPAGKQWQLQGWAAA